MGLSARRRPHRPEQRRLSIRERIARFVRALFSSGTAGDDPRDVEGGVGVREPRRPLAPTLSGAAALEPPPTETRDVRAIGEDRD